MNLNSITNSMEIRLGEKLLLKDTNNLDWWETNEVKIVFAVLSYILLYFFYIYTM